MPLHRKVQPSVELAAARLKENCSIDPIPAVLKKHDKPMTFTDKLLQMSGIEPVIDDRDGRGTPFRTAQAIVVLCDFNGQHSAHTCPIPVPKHEGDVEYFKRMEPIVKTFYTSIGPKVRAIKVVSTVLEINLNDGSRSYYAIQCR